MLLKTLNPESYSIDTVVFKELFSVDIHTGTKLLETVQVSFGLPPVSWQCFKPITIFLKIATARIIE